MVCPSRCDIPFYDYMCDRCEEGFERMLSISRFDEPQPCPKCNEVARKVVTGCNFNLPGDGWASKNIRVAGQMAKKNTRLTASTSTIKREAPPVTLVPNVDGERVGSWGEAQKLAASKGKDATTYAPKIAAETSKK